MVVVVICGSCGSGSSASSTPAVAASSSTLPKEMCDAPVKLSSGTTGQKLSNTGFQNL